MQALAEHRVGRTFGRVADQYERSRPEYPREAIAHAARELGLGPTSRVLDLAAGTGKLTRRLAEQFGAVVAVEPDDDMRRHVAGDARRGTAEDIPVPDGYVDAVFVADGFHWFDADAALPEIARVARPGGGLALLWNDWWEKEQPPMPAEARAVLDDLFERFEAERSTNREWRRDVERALGPLGHARFTSVAQFDRSRFAELCLTMSSPAALPEDEFADVAERLDAALRGDYVVDVSTDLYWGRLP